MVAEGLQVGSIKEILRGDSQAQTDSFDRLYVQLVSLRIIVAAWDGKPDSFCASVLRGMMHFVELYYGEFSEERLVRALGSVHPIEIYRVGRDNPAKLPGLAAVRLSQLHHLQRQVQERCTADEVLKHISYAKGHLQATGASYYIIISHYRYF